MKNILKNAVRKFLEMLVKIKLQRTQPKIIGVTGSFGKTSTKEAVYEVLKTRWAVYRNPKSLNTELGILLAVLEQPSGFSSPLKWLHVLSAAAINAFAGKKYDFLVLEYGADKPGDIEHLISVVKPHVAIITHIAAVHQDEGQFKDERAVFEEKKKLAMAAGIVILNRGDVWLQALPEKLENNLTAKIFWFGKGGDIYAENLKNTSGGFEAEIHMGTRKADAEFSIAGAYHIDIVLPALLVGTLHGITLEEGIKALQNFQLPPGRMSIIEGKHGAILLDGSYNASPETMTTALNLLKEFPSERKIAVLGNMNELGAHAREAHREVAHHIGPWLDMLITVGEQAALIADEALKRNFPSSRIKVLLDAQQAAEFLLSIKLRKGDVILFKGSQNRVRLERAVKILMVNPKDAKKLLCRQEPEWSRIE